MDRHLVTVEVGVERGADQRVDLDGRALDEQGLEGLDAETVQRGGPVQEYGVLLDDLLEDVPDLGAPVVCLRAGRQRPARRVRGPPAVPRRRR